METKNSTDYLRLTDFIGYLPHGLNYTYDQGGNGIEFDYNRMIDEDEWSSAVYDLTNQNKNYKPILRPIMDLYRPIMHNREEIIPILRLALIADPMCKYELAGDRAENQEQTQFWFCPEKKCFRLQCNGGYEYYITDQHLLYDYMDMLKIDYRGLIERGLAVDVNLLDENPYK
jgi:hypothetical protein